MFRNRPALGMAFVSATALAFEVALTRICSVLLQYHLSFAVVSMAVLGGGLGGFAAWFWARRVRGGADAVADVAFVALGPSLVVALVALLRLPFASGWPVLLLLVLPAFAAAGAFLSLTLRAFLARAGRLYAADLGGGAAGVWVAIAAMGALGGPVNVTLAIAVLAAALAWSWTRGRPAGARLAPGALVAVVLVTLVHALFGVLDVDYARAPQKLLARMLQPGPQGTPHLLPRLARWDAYSRVDVLELDAPRGVQRLVFIDGETPTPMLHVDPVSPNAAGVSVVDALAALPLRLVPPQRVLSIGPGGGYDVVAAKRFGAAAVDAVELNAGVLAVVDAAREFTGDVYRQPGVRLYHAEGRQFARRAPAGSYDLIVLALAQSLAGNLQEYALSENYLYTREAFADYLRALTPDGAIEFLVSSPVMQAKLSRTALEVLAAQGLPATECVFAATSRGEVPYDHLLLVRKAPFTPAERDRLTREIESRRYTVLQAPAGVGVPAALRASAPEAGVRLGPATDEKPFFFHLEPGMPAGVRLLLWGATAALVLAGAGLVIAARHSPRPPERAVVAPRAVLAGAYFVLLGLGFLMVEVLVLQRTVLFLGYPILNLGVVLSTFLIGAGCGSATSQRWQSRRGLQAVLLGVAIAIALLLPGLGALHARLDPLALPLRAAVVAAIVFPFAFAMGMPFPWGVRLLSQRAQELVPWYWGLNGIASVVGSALVVAVVLERGFRVTGLLPAAVYALAAGAAFVLERRAAVEAPSQHSLAG